MTQAHRSLNHRPREWRRRVSLQSLVRSDGGWGSACILNISSRGFLIEATRPTPKGSTVELRHNGHVIMAKVVWREGARAGLTTEVKIPVEDILSLDQASSLQLTAVGGGQVERRKQPRWHSDSRICSHLIQCVGVGLIGLTLVGAIGTLVAESLTASMARVEATLSGNS